MFFAYRFIYMLEFSIAIPGICARVYTVNPVLCSVLPIYHAGCVRCSLLSAASCLDMP